MECRKISLNKYPKFHRKGSVPGSYDPKLAFTSRYLKPGCQFPIKGDSTELNRLCESLGQKIAELHTALSFSKHHLDKVRVIPDSGTPEAGAAWLQPHVERYNAVSFDTESCHIFGELTFCIFGTMDGFVLIVDQRKCGGETLSPALKNLLANRLVLGSGISANDSKILRGVPCKMGDTIPFSRKIQSHSKYPYQVENYLPGTKPGLKHIPEMLYGHCYGPLATRKGARSDGTRRAGFPQPFDWPDWLYPTKMYTFKDGPPKLEQLTYMYNDAVAPFLHLMLMTNLELAEGNVDDTVSMEEALSLTTKRFFPIPTNSSETTMTTPESSKPLPIPKRKEDSSGPDLWASLGGIAPGISDDALLESLMYLPDDILLKIQNFMDLDTEDSEDADFIELYGGLFTLARASNVIEDHGLLHGVKDDKRVSLSSASDEAYVSDGMEVDCCAPVQYAQSDAQSSGTPTPAPPVLLADQSSQTALEHRDAGVQSSPRPEIRHQETQSHEPAEPPVKRRRITIEVWAENGQIHAALPPDSLPAGPEATAERRASEPATDCDQEEPAAAAEVDPPSARVAAVAFEDDISDRRTLRRPQDVSASERLGLLSGSVQDVAIPNMTEIPSRFGSSPDFGPRCSQCGHKQDFAKPGKVHPVDACPVLGRYGSEAFNPVTGTWRSAPCLYPLCHRKGHHFTKMCTELQSLCLRCGVRGHSTSRCDLVSLEYSKEALADAYSVFKSFGLRSRKWSRCQDWDFRPELPSFRVITLQDKNYLFPWTEEEAHRISKLSLSQIKTEILQELYK